MTHERTQLAADMDPQSHIEVTVHDLLTAWPAPSSASVASLLLGVFFSSPVAASCERSESSMASYADKAVTDLPGGNLACRGQGDSGRVWV